MTSPDPGTLYPLPGHANTAFIKPLLATRPEVTNVTAGEFSYYSDFNDPTKFLDDNVLYNFGFSGVRLEIGRYCALAHGTTFIMADANHTIAGPSTFPFPIFGGDWAEAMPIAEMPFLDKGDTIVGNDVWFGYQSLVMPGVAIGTGAIVAARAVVTRDVPPYGIVAGNPARLVRTRYDDAAIERLLALAWWDWSAEAVASAIPLLVNGDVSALEDFAQAANLTA